MFRRILIANRGEIAIRIIRTCQEMDIETVAVYSRADADALHVKLATYAICIGEGRAEESYLNQKAVISAAVAYKCDAVHPGYGFLSENADFAELCEKNGITFIGPSPEAIRRFGDKSTARQTMKDAGVPVIPGSDGIVASAEEGADIAENIGYPVLIKASAGGGGRGMRRVDSPEKFNEMFEEARAEAKANFGNGALYIEKLVQNTKHIEFQILADDYGHVIHLGERDCSVQRRNQKMIEETPSRTIPAELRDKMGKTAVLCAEAGGYTNAGTVEFLCTEKGEYYFMEMNARIQVEHGITEMVTGIDIVREQIRIASGMSLDMEQDDVVFSGHAIECRINAEDPDNGFRPSPGKVSFIHIPGGKGVRVDTALYSGCSVSPYYDSLIAKVIARGKTRLEALKIMRRALEELIIDGIKTNISFMCLILYDTDFARGRYDTGFIDGKLSTFVNWDMFYDGISQMENGRWIHLK
ncbi:MAG: acetyl-CoA carboxylase biotin carboxylase subunit [Anaerovoracaceae bacterium]|nr:acetyl-CoA carboxylase biotin carboxylase subunit [Bacillota bacterium]MDY2670250.1 acetyl-CoA carboxylase biotin carboxylase subunit [Anaerovoracaceae bacterium]